MDMFTYFSTHPTTGFVFMCLSLPAMAWPITVLVTKLFVLFNQGLRTINIVRQGWPPEYLDADGSQYNVVDDEEEEEGDFGDLIEEIIREDDDEEEEEK